MPNNSDERESLQDLLDQCEHRIGIELGVPQVRFRPREQLMPLDGRRISGTGHKGFRRKRHATIGAIAKPQLARGFAWGRINLLKFCSFACLELSMRSPSRVRARSAYVCLDTIALHVRRSATGQMKRSLRVVTRLG